MNARQIERETSIIAAVRCPRCGSPIGQPCRKGRPLLAAGPCGGTIQFLQPFIARCHSERRAAWVIAKGDAARLDRQRAIAQALYAKGPANP
jgi:hypothetical protein